MLGNWETTSNSLFRFSVTGIITGILERFAGIRRLLLTLNGSKTFKFIRF